MTITPLTSAQLARWNKWLESSHGLSGLPGHTIYRCDIDYTMYLTPWTNLNGFALRQERDSEQVLISLDLVPGTRTIANLWAGPGLFHSGFRRSADFIKMEKALLEAIRQGRVWWGTETLTDKSFHTSVAYWFPEEFPLPGNIPVPT